MDIYDVDAQLLALLQQNARYTATELATRVGVSDNTIHNRMQRLEEAGVITGYTTIVDHDRTGFSLYFSFVCTARISNRCRVAEEAMTIPEVTEVTELMTGRQNLQIKAYGVEDEDITRIAKRLDELELEIDDENLVRSEHTQPLEYSKLDRMPDAEE